MAKEETKPKELKPKAKVEEVGPCKLKVAVQITAAKVKERIDQKYKDLSDSVALPINPNIRPATIRSVATRR